MQKKITLPILAAIAGVVLAITFSAFKTVSPKHDASKWSNVYFQYAGTDETNTNLGTHSNWTELPSLPGSNPCTSGTALVCVSHLDATTLAGQAGADDVAKFITYISAHGFATYIDANRDFIKR